MADLEEVRYLGITDTHYTDIDPSWQSRLCWAGLMGPGYLKISEKRTKHAADVWLRGDKSAHGM